MSETRLELQIVENSKSAIAALDNLANALGRVSSAVSHGFANVSTKNIQRFGQAISNAVTQTTVRNYERLAQALESVSKAASKVPNLQSLQNTLGKVNDATSGLMPKQSETSRLGGDIEKQIESIAPAAKEAASANHTLRDRLRELFATTSGAKRNMGGLLSSFARIAKYRFLRAVLKEITEGFKFGFENMYQYAKYVGHSFAPAVDSAKDALFKMKNSIGAALAPAIQMLIPYLVQAVNWFINLLNIVNQFLSLLRGQSTWTRATNASASTLDKVKDSAKGASASVKELKGLLADWDELNIIQQETGGGGGGGSGSKADEDLSKYGLLFEQVDTFDGKIKGIIDKIRPFIEWIKDNLELIKGLALLTGAAILGWKLNNAFEGGIGKAIVRFAGLIIAIEGVKEEYAALKDQWDNGINWDNFTQLVKGASGAILGLTMSFGIKGLGAGLLGTGLAGIVTALKDIIENGKASKEALSQLKMSLLISGIGASLMSGNWLFALAGAVSSAAVSIYENREKITKYITENIAEITGLLKDVGLSGIAVGALLAFSGVNLPIGIAMIAAGLGLVATANGLPDTITGDIDTTFKNIAGLVGRSTMAVGAMLAISGVATIPGIAMMAAGLALDTYGSGSGKDLKTYITSAWGEMKQYLIPASLGMFALGAVFAISGAAIVPGLKMMAMGAVGLGTGAVVGNLLDDLKTMWESIKSWALPASLGVFALGAVLALSGVAILPGIVMMATGAAGLGADAVTGNLLEDLKKTWDEIKGWAFPASFGLFALGAVLALTGVSIIPGIKMMAVGAIGIGTSAVTGSLLNDLTETWNSIKSWALPASLGLFALGAVLALTGVAIIPGVGLMATGAIGLGIGAVTGDLLGDLKQAWLAIDEFAAPLSVGSFVLGMILALTGVGVVPGLVMMAAGVAGMAASYKSGGLLSEITSAWESMTSYWNETVKPGFDFVVNFVDSSVVQPIVNFFKNLFRKIRSYVNLIGSFFTLLWESTIYPVVNWIDLNIIQPIIEFFGNLWKLIKGEDNPISEWWEDLWYNKIGGVVEWIKTNVTGKIAGFFEGLWSTIQKVFGFLSGAGQENYFMNEGAEMLTDSVEEFLKGINSTKLDTYFNDSSDLFGEYLEGWLQAGMNPTEAINSALKDIMMGDWQMAELAEQAEKLGISFMDLFSDGVKQSIFDMDILDGLVDENGNEIEYELDIDEASFATELPAPNTEQFVSGIQGAEEDFTQAVSGILDAASSLDGMSFSFTYEGTGYGAWNGMAPRIPKRANGGFVTTGDMFIANEAGPELVGTIGGRTAVANEGQIVAGISSGVAAASRGQERLLVNIIDRLERIEQKEFTAKAVPSSGWGKFNRISNEMYARNTGR